MGCLFTKILRFLHKKIRPFFYRAKKVKKVKKSEKMVKKRVFLGYQGPDQTLQKVDFGSPKRGGYP
jgi:hypothetical protein